VGLGYRQPMDDRPRWRWRDARLWPWVIDGLLGVAVAAVQLLMLALGVNQGGPVPYTKPNVLAVLLILAQGLPLAWRRQRPLLVFAVVLAANTAYYAVAFPPSQFDFGLPIALFTVAAECSQRTSLLACVTVLVLFAAQWLGGVGVYWSSANWVRVLYLVFFFSAVWAWGRYVRIRRAYTAELAARAEQAERDRQQEAQRAVAAERARIARELHDVVAHHLSVMVIQAGAARRLLDDDPEQARAALAAIEESGRQGLGAMPGLLRALRDDQQLDDGLAPQPTLSELEALVAQVQAAGLPVQLRIEGTPRPLPAAVDLSAYRVAQEALTNTLKHAGPARAQLLVRYGRDALEITAVDDGSGTEPTANGPSRPGGQGLVGMRERVSLFGGELRAGARPEGGFGVFARFPLEAGST
jgi:signal transduction histidine kinase